MTSPRPIQKTHPISTHPKNCESRPPQEQQHLLQCFQAFRLPWGGWKLVTSDRAIFTSSVDSQRKKRISNWIFFPQVWAGGKEFLNQKYVFVATAFRRHHHRSL